MRVKGHPLYLKSLTLKGFKSFAQSTTFAFEPGVTCVVGPNGSGKSNVVDALAWVMGEQGVKTLRGGKMEDVIFAGTATRGPLGRAEVTLTIDNSDGMLPIDYTEVTISRTLFRNGASEYAINGRTCRLLDVQELLSDSGLGREMHVIVGQGQLDAVLRASPEERRGFIEEAAGILKHRRRKEKTVRKLAAMQTNLTRLSDLAGEIRRQLKPLGHQAEIARTAQTIAAVVRDARARLLADDVVTLRIMLNAHSRTEQERHTERVGLQEQLVHQQGQLERLELLQAGDAVDLARRVSFGLESVQERLRGLYTLANQRLALLGAQADSSHVVVRVTPAMLSQARDEVRQLRLAIVAAEAQWDAARQQSSAARARLDTADENIAAEASLITSHDLRISRLAGQSETAASKLAAVRGEALRQEHAHNAAIERSRLAAAQLHELTAENPAEEPGTTALAVPSEQSAATDLSATVERAQDTVHNAEAAVDQLRDTLHQHERERDAQAARHSALSLALDQKDGSSALLGAQLSGIRGLVADHVRVQPGFEVAIAAALGSRADAVLADNHQAAVEAVVRAGRDNFGRVELVVAQAGAAAPNSPGTSGEGSGEPGASAHPRGGDVVFNLGSLPGVRWATSVVHAEAGVQGLLANMVIVDTLDLARSLTLPGNLTLITLTGEVLAPFAVSGGSGSVQSKLELVAERDLAAQRLALAVSLVASARTHLFEQRARVQVQKERAAEARASLRAFETHRAAQAERSGRLVVQAAAAADDVERVSAALQLASSVVSDAEDAAERAAATELAARAEARPLLNTSVRDALSLTLEAVREAEVEARLRVDTARERVRVGERNVTTLSAQAEADRAAATDAARRSVLRQRQVSAASRVANALPAALDAAARWHSEAQVRLAGAEAERAEHNTELQQLRREEHIVRERLAALTENVHGLEREIYEKTLQLSAVLERAASELGLVEDVLVAEYGPDQLIPADAATRQENKLGAERERANDSTNSRGGIRFIRSEQQKRFVAAERKLGELGRVNPLALEEFAALEQRHRFLTEQLTDLTETRGDLITIITDIDEKMQAIFLAAFDDTQSAFAEVFPVLFPGGSGSIWLTDPSDVLTTGIELSVKPAGKKIERLSLLSGGERSLAAVALLIAIFKARPSPFYIMDEVEAALDDANLGRLLTIFDDLREASQLIVITHQKRTMEIADALYGVSMRHDGVSAVIGQRVAHRHEPGGATT